MSCIIMNRRALWKGAVGVAAMSLLAACGTNGGGNSGPSLPSTILDYISKIAAAVSKMVGDLGSLVPTNIIGRIKTLADEAAALASQIASTTGGSLSGLVQNFTSVISSIIATLVSGGFSPPSWLSRILSAIEALLPFILSAIGVAAPRRRMVAGMVPSPDDALNILDNYLRASVRR